MNRIVTATVIRGDGECQAYINGVVSAEIKRQQEMMRAEREHAKVVEMSRNNLLRRNLEDINRRIQRRKNPVYRAYRKVSNAWAAGWAVLICWPEIFINLCLKYKLIEREGAA